ncbi:AAA family ATPase [Gordonia sp. SID5947]|uniref:BTAD domain-containing putative transcriptional regulator n=1 Tax=Gordonia sp. SID5947 TaxID=2690315 RepID=UPI001367F485|nr:BTAD domain-containing putative transcriptional regulator [Gordonia sp. SID5947]MYR07804.1 AAA family ATPase [Gordonia sp. SID5947]
MSTRVEAAEPTVSVTMSGTVRVEVAGRPAEVKSRRERAVLARLVAADGHVVSTDRLIDDLWNGEPPPKALGGLQVHISNLRRILEPNRPPRSPARILVSEPPGYALRMPRESVDLWHFADLVHADDDDPAARYERLDAAIALWHGEPFGSHAGEDWARTSVARFDELYLTAREQHAGAALELGRPAEVAARLPELCERHSTREELFRLLALAQYRLGRQADALQTLRSVRDYLADELGVDPSPAIRGLEAAILQQDPALQLAPPPDDPRTVPVPAVPPRTKPVRTGHEFAGREAELEKLATHAKSALRTGLRVVWITAEAGGGKSTLAHLLVGRLRDHGWATAIGHCPEVDGAPTAWAWRDVVDALGADNEIEDPFLIARQVRAACEAAPTAGGGVVVVLDDVHRADSATLQVLRQVVTWLAEQPVLVVATYRPSEAETELLATAASLTSVTADHLTLAGLSEDGIRELAASVGLDPVDETTLEMLRRRTDGNPLFARELARLVASRGPRDASTAVPSGVREVLLHRVERLPPEAVSVMRLVAICGRDADIDTVVALHPDDAGGEDAVLDAIDTAVVADLLSASVDRVRFNHVLTRDAVYDSIPALRRRRLHWRAFIYLRDRAEVPLDELAHHAALGAGPGTAVEALLVVETAARQRFSLEADTAQLWRSAVDLHLMAGHDRPSAARDDRTALVRALCDLVTALAHRGEVSEARARREEALLLARSVGDDDLVLSALTSWRTPTIWTTRPNRLLDDVMSTAVREALPGTSGADRVRLLVTAVFEFEGNEQQFAVESAREAVEIARDLDDIDLMCAALNARVYTSMGPDQRVEHPAIAADFVSAAKESGNLDYQAVAHFFRSLVRSGETDLPGATAEMQLAMQSATSSKVGELVVVLATFRAVLDVLRGDLDQADQTYQAIGMQLAAAGLPAANEFTLISHLCVGWHRGSIGHLVDGARLLYESAPESIAWVYVVALLDAGRDDEAREIAEQDIPVVRDYYWSALAAFHARALARLGMAEKAARLYEELNGWSGAIAGLDSGSVVFGPIDVVLAELAETMGDRQAAVRHRRLAAEVEEKVRRGLAQLG